MTSTSETDRLRAILEKVVAELHDASQVSGRDNTIRVAPLLAIIGDAVQCPDCLAWGSEEEQEQTDKDIIELTARVAEDEAERALDEHLRRRP